jgi:hypothetical protein
MTSPAEPSVEITPGDGEEEVIIIEIDSDGGE